MSKPLVLILALSLFIGGCAPAAAPPTGTAPAAAAPADTAPAAAASTATPATPAGAAPTIIKEDEPMTVTVTAPAVVAIEAAATITGVIDWEMRRSFDFFWEQANTDPDSPGYGLIRDRYPGNKDVASIASVGFGLTALPIGISRGYIGYDQGYERADGTLDTLLAMDRVEGFFFHFVDITTGNRVWKSEVSDIDTSILLMGVLSAGQFFGGEVQRKAQQIYDGVNWPWFYDESRAMFYMGFKPEEGHFGHWDFYAEHLMMYILAAGSDTYPVGEEAYYTFTRHYARYGDGRPFIHSWFNSIFTYQYTHAWIDFRDTTDREGVNWFDNSVEASLAHVNYATRMAALGKYETLGPDAWGLTASDGPNGYEGRYGAPPSGYDNTMHFIDDTVAPCGAIGSIIFVPEHAGRAMLNYYSIERLKGRYGFSDAYNLAKDWYAPDVIGIDKGVSLLMLANYQDGFVYSLMMNNENIVQGLDRLQIVKSER